MRYNSIEHTIENDKGVTLLSFTKEVDTRQAYAVLDTLERHTAVQHAYLDLSRKYSNLQVQVDHLTQELTELKARP